MNNNLNNLNSDWHLYHWKEISSEEVKNLDNFSSENYYGLSNAVLKQLIEQLFYPLASIINWMFEYGHSLFIKEIENM